MPAPAPPADPITPLRFWRYTLAVVAGWTLLVAAGLFWMHIEDQQAGLSQARLQADTMLVNAEQFIRWAARSGAFYATSAAHLPTSLRTRSGDDFVVPATDGRVLTQVSPMVVAHQLLQSGDPYGIRGHLTSLTPLEPANAPDAWEVSALQTLARGQKDVSSLEVIEGSSYLRVMRPLAAEVSCLSCHTEHNLKVGAIRGGISATVPMARVWQASAQPRQTAGLVGILLWLAGVIGIGAGARRTRLRGQERDRHLAVIRDSEARYRMLFAANPQPMWVFDRETLRFLAVNEAAQTHYGYTEEEFLALPAPALHPPADLARLYDDQAALPMSGQHRKRDGSLIEVEAVSHSVDFGGRPGTLVLATDVTERRRLEVLAQNSRVELAAIYDHAPIIMCLFDEHHRIVRLNRAAAAWAQKGAISLIGQRWGEAFGCDHAPDDPRGCGSSPACQECGMRRTLHDTFVTGRSHMGVEVQPGRILGLDRPHVQVIVHTARIEIDGRKNVLLCLEDVTTRRQAEVARGETESRYRLIVENVSEGIGMLDADARFTYVNPAAEHIFGVPSGSLLGRSLGEFMPEAPFASYRERSALGHDGAAPPSVDEFAFRLASGLKRTVLASTAPRYDSLGQFIGGLGVFRDITARKQADDALRESESMLHAAQLAAGLGTYVLDLATGRWSSSRVLDTVLGLTADYDHSVAGWEALLHPDDREVMTVYFQVEVLEGRKAFDREYRIVRPSDREVRWVHGLGRLEFDAEGRPVKMRGSIQDVSPRKLSEATLKQSEERFRQAQKMDAVGQLAGGVAHDFNNILAAVLMQLGLLQYDTRIDASVRAQLRDLEKEAHRGAGLTRQLLAFSRQQAMEATVVDMHVVVAGLMKMLHRLLGEHIAMSLHGSDISLVEADPSMMEQVVINLCVNARDAMPRGGQLTITLETSNVTADNVSAHADARPGRFLLMAVTDTGCGMSATTRQRLFEPFFTTKEVGRGTGLGLATVYGIIRQHQGWVEVESVVGRGSTFRVYLPLATAPLPAAGAPADQPTPPRGRNEMVLVVEDELSVRVVVAATLRLHGYRTLEASDGPEALVLWRRHQSEIAMVFTDMRMPDGLTGLGLIGLCRKERPDLKAIIFTGYSREIPKPALDQNARIVILHKPAGPEKLLAVVRQCLDSRET